MSAPPIPADVSSVIDGWPADMQATARRLRALVFETAEETATGPLTETLKWGEPAYLTDASRSGTTIRLGWVQDAALPCRLLVNCRTDLVDRYRARFGAELSFEGDRAIRLPAGAELPELPLRSCIAMALTYHRDRRARHG